MMKRKSLQDEIMGSVDIAREALLHFTKEQIEGALDAELVRLSKEQEQYYDNNVSISQGIAIDALVDLSLGQRPSDQNAYELRIKVQVIKRTVTNLEANQLHIK